MKHFSIVKHAKIFFSLTALVLLIHLVLEGLDALLYLLGFF